MLARVIFTTMEGGMSHTWEIVKVRLVVSRPSRIIPKHDGHIRECISTDQLPTFAISHGLSISRKDHNIHAETLDGKFARV